jgi:hypothetical protein
LGETNVSNEQKENEVPSEYLLDLTKGPDNQPAQAEPAQEQPGDELPEKYKGKTLAEVIEMHRNAESALGRAHNEVGSVRRLADELLGIHRATVGKPASETPPAREKITPDLILSDPERAVVSAAKEVADERVNASEERLARMEYELTLAKFEQKHPSFRATMEDQGFREWVQRSPLRQRLAYSATQGDFASADELFSLYNEIQSGRSEEPAGPTQQEAARKATLARPGGSTAARVVNTQTGKPVFSREKLLEMRINNPDEFERLQPQILEAYAEKRVR